MKAFLQKSNRHEVLIDLQGENDAEQVLLAHLQDQHVSILCAGRYGEGPLKGAGLRLFIRNENEIEIEPRIKPGIERAMKRKARRRR